MSEATARREANIKGYAAETALCIDLPLSALQAQIEAELAASGADPLAALQRVLQAVKQHRRMVSSFARPKTFD